MSNEYWRTKQIADDQFRAGIDAMRAEDREKVAACILSLGLATGHGDTLDDLLSELKWQVEELQDNLFKK